MHKSLTLGRRKGPSLQLALALDTADAVMSRFHSQGEEFGARWHTRSRAGAWVTLHKHRGVWSLQRYSQFAFGLETAPRRAAGRGLCKDAHLQTSMGVSRTQSVMDSQTTFSSK
jgi:hypothetical protein